MFFNAYLMVCLVGFDDYLYDMHSTNSLLQGFEAISTSPLEAKENGHSHFHYLASLFSVNSRACLC